MNYVIHRTKSNDVANYTTKNSTIRIYPGDTVTLVSKSHTKSYVAFEDNNVYDECGGCVFSKGRACYYYPFVCSDVILRPAEEMLEDL